MPLANTVEKQIGRRENLLFLQRWLKHPLQLGTLAPISVRLANLAAKSLALSPDFPSTNNFFVEIGAGTGRLSRALLKNGVRPENLALVELDKVFCDFLRDTLPQVLSPEKEETETAAPKTIPKIIEGDAVYLPDLLPANFVGKVDIVFSVIPLMYLAPAVRRNLIAAAFKVLKPGGFIAHVTYSPRSPIRFMADIDQKCYGRLWLNCPPGFVWHYRKQ